SRRSEHKQDDETGYAESRHRADSLRDEEIIPLRPNGCRRRCMPVTKFSSSMHFEPQGLMSDRVCLVVDDEPVIRTYRRAIPEPEHCNDCGQSQGIPATDSC